MDIKPKSNGRSCRFSKEIKTPAVTKSTNIRPQGSLEQYARHPSNQPPTLKSHPRFTASISHSHPLYPKLHGNTQQHVFLQSFAASRQHCTIPTLGLPRVPIRQHPLSAGLSGKPVRRNGSDASLPRSAAASLTAPNPGVKNTVDEVAA